MTTSDTEADVSLERCIATAVGHGRERYADATWQYLHDSRMPDMPHGWKLHVSTRPALLTATVERVFAVVLRYRCHAKFAINREVLRRINAGAANPAAVGKAVTVYPDPECVADIGNELVDALSGWQGPQVLSDRRIDPGSPVYYRYGQYRPRYRMTVDGEPEPIMVGPDGDVFPAVAGVEYACPPWAHDPFDPPRRGNGKGPVRDARVADRYRVTAGVKRSPHGNVYRATEAATGRRVVIKQARAFVGEDPSGVDARDRLRSERGVLDVLADVDGVPDVVDHFGSADEEYLVMSSCGGSDLRNHVRESGVYRTSTGRDGFIALAERLLRILDAAHARGVVLRDLTPGNVVVDESDQVSVVDFGVSQLHGGHAVGGTPGYRAPGVPDDGAAEPADDYYSLGATLSFAVTGIDPVVVDEDAELNRDRTLECLAAALRDDGVDTATAPVEYDVIARLLSTNPDERAAGAHRIRDSRQRTPLSRVDLPTTAHLSGHRLDAVVEHALNYCREQAGELARSGLEASTRQSPLGIFTGTAGIGLELLRHSTRSDVRRTVAELAHWTATAELADTLPPGFYCGSTGVELFLVESAAHLGDNGSDTSGIDTSARMRWLRTAPLEYWLDVGERTDQLHGLAGVGTGQLLLARHAERYARVEDRARHLAIADECARRLDAAEPVVHESTGPAAAMWRHGFAHGTAGVAYFLVEYARVRGGEADRQRAHDVVGELAAQARLLVDARDDPVMTGRAYGSWCNGLTGIATLLLRAGLIHEEESWLDDALRAARTCHAHAPNMALVHQCCGLAGVGELLLDAAEATGHDGYRDMAGDVAGLILTRSGGAADSPVFPDHTRNGASPVWGTGTSGVLSFLRRLRDGGAERLTMPPLRA